MEYKKTLGGKRRPVAIRKIELEQTYDRGNPGEQKICRGLSDL